MRHIFKCVECGADFVKVDALVLCEACRNKPPKEEVEAIVVAEADESPVVEAVIAKPTKKTKKSAGGE